MPPWPAGASQETTNNPDSSRDSICKTISLLRPSGRRGNLRNRGLRRLGRGCFGPALRRRGLLPHLLEILLHILLKRDRYLVAIDLAARLPMRRLAVRIRRAKLLLRGIHLDGDFAGHVRRAFA